MILRLFIFLMIAFCALPAQAEMTDYPAVKLRTLDKSTARTNTLEAKVGATIKFGSLFIKVQACRESDPLDKPESAVFLQIWEVPVNSDESQWVFSGWMFASSPALSAMDHPVYDVWVLDCAGREDQAAPTKGVSVQIDGEDTDDLMAPEATSEDQTQEPAVPVENEQPADDEAVIDSKAIQEPQSQTEAVPQAESNSEDQAIDSVIDNLMSDRPQAE